MLASWIPGSWVVQIRDAGHGIMYEYPSEINRALMAFLENSHELKEVSHETILTDLNTPSHFLWWAKGELLHAWKVGSLSVSNPNYDDRWISSLMKLLYCFNSYAEWRAPRDSWKAYLLFRQLFIHSKKIEMHSMRASRYRFPVTYCIIRRLLRSSHSTT